MVKSNEKIFVNTASKIVKTLMEGIFFLILLIVVF